MRYQEFLQAAVDQETRRAVTELLENFATAIAAKRINECAPMLSEDFLRNGVFDKASALDDFEEDIEELRRSTVAIHADTIWSELGTDEVQVSGRLVVDRPGRETKEHAIRWTLRREGSQWVISRWDRAS